MGAAAAELFRHLHETAIFFVIHQNQFDERIGLSEIELTAPVFSTISAGPCNGTKTDNNPVSARGTARHEAVTAGNSKPGFQKNKQGGKGSKPTTKRRPNWSKSRPHTFVLIYL